MTVNSRVVRSFVASCPDAVDVPLKDGLRVQILPSVADLPKARKYQFAAFLAAEELLLVWDDDAANLIKRAKAIESELMDLIWRSNQDSTEEEEINEKVVRSTVVELDPESGDPIPENRPTNLMNSILVAFTLAIVITLLGLAARSLAVEISVDHDYIRLAFLALVPVQIFFTLVCVSLDLFDWQLLTVIVLRPSYRRLYSPMCRPSPADATQLQVLLCYVSTTTSPRAPSSHHHPVPSLQRGSCRSHRSHCQIYQASHIDIRAPGRISKHVCQR